MTKKQRQMRNKLSANNSNLTTCVFHISHTHTHIHAHTRSYVEDISISGFRPFKGPLDRGGMFGVRLSVGGKRGTGKFQDGA